MNQIPIRRLLDLFERRAYLLSRFEVTLIVHERSLFKIDWKEDLHQRVSLLILFKIELLIRSDVLFEIIMVSNVKLISWLIDPLKLLSCYRPQKLLYIQAPALCLEIIEDLISSVLLDYHIINVKLLHDFLELLLIYLLSFVNINSLF